MSDIEIEEDTLNESIQTGTPSDDNLQRSVDGLQKWVSAVEDKVIVCSTELEKLNELVTQNEATLKAIVDSLKELNQCVQTKNRIKRMTECNRELGLALSAKIYRSEAKRAKTETFTPITTFHPSVLPFIFSDTEEDSDVQSKENEKP
jgi:hypothetical protein